MDYGKLAYLKVEELEKSLSSLLKKERSINRRFTAKPLRNLQKGAYAFPTIYSSGSVSVIITAQVTANAQTTGELILLSNGVKVSGKSLTLDANETSETVFTVAVESEGELKLSLTSSTAITLNSVELLVSGTGADLSLSPVRSAMDKYSYYWAIVECNDGLVTVKNFYEEEQVFYRTLTLGEGVSCDICADESGFAVTHTDILGNTFVNFLDINLNKKGNLVLTDGASCSIIGKAENGCALGLIIKGKLYLRMVSREGVSALMAVEEVDKADEVTFVKASNPLALIVTVDGKSRLLRALAEHGGRENITLSLGVTSEAI